MSQDNYPVELANVRESVKNRNDGMVAERGGNHILHDGFSALIDTASGKVSHRQIPVYLVCVGLGRR